MLINIFKIIKKFYLYMILDISTILLYLMLEL